MMLQVLLTGTGFAAVAWGLCTRAFLKSATDTYVEAQTKGDTANISVIAAEDMKFYENNNVVDLAKSTLAQPIKIDFTRSIRDTVKCATFTEIIAATNPHPYVIHTRMEFSPDTQKATLIETIVTDDGDWAFNATGTLTLNVPEKWEPIPKDKQESREVIKAAGDAYFDRFGNVSVTVPWGEPCVRLEGGFSVAGRIEDGECVMVWPSTIIIPYRRYVVDEEMGAVDLFIGFPGLDRSQGQKPMPDSHLFRVEGGKIKYCHTASACVEDGCGL
jgi:hypothetical protein